MPRTPNDDNFDPNKYIHIEQHTKDINELAEKVHKCYSEERYQQFQNHVEEIALKTLKGEDGRKQVKEYAKEAAKEHIESETWKSKTLWIPVSISVIGIIISVIIAVFIK